MNNPHDPSQPYFPCEPLLPDGFDDAAQQYVNTVEVACTPQALFGVFEDAGSWPWWAPGIGRVQWTSPQPYQVGTTRTVFFWGGMQVYEDFVVWDAPRRMAFTFTGTSQQVWRRFGERYDVTDLGGGRCRLVWRVSYDPVGPFAKLHGLVRPSMVLAFKLYMVLLKRYVRRNVAA